MHNSLGFVFCRQFLSKIRNKNTEVQHNGDCVVQVVGFMILVAGTSMYNELLRGCLPGVPPPVSQEDSLEVSCPTTYFLDIIVALSSARNMFKWQWPF